MTEPGKKRRCAPCTACCDGWLQININGTAVYPGRPCPHVTGAGCSIYPDRPAVPCMAFECGWLVENSPLPDWMRPDLVNVIVVFNKYQLKHWRIDGAVYAGGEITADAFDWLTRFTLEQGRQLIVTGMVGDTNTDAQRTTIKVFGSEDFRSEIGRLMNSGRFLQEVKGFSVT